MEREKEEEGRGQASEKKGVEKKRRTTVRERQEVVMCVSTRETDDLPGEREDRVRCVQRVGEE